MPAVDAVGPVSAAPGPVASLKHLDTSMAVASSLLSPAMAVNGGSAPGTPTTANDTKRKARLLNQGLYFFQDIFWGVDSTPPTEGVTVLHEVFSQHLSEAEDLIAIVRTKVEIEEMAASRLADLVTNPPVHAPGGNPAPATTFFPSFSSASSSSPVTPPSTGRKRAATSSLLSSSSGSASPHPNGTTLGNTLSAFRDWVSSSSTSSQKDSNGSAATASANMISIVDATTDPAFGSVQEGEKGGKPVDAVPTIEFEAPGTPMVEDRKPQFDEKAAPVVETNVDTSSLAPAVRTLREQLMAMAAIHRRHADTLTLAVLSPLTAFVDQQRRALNKKKAEVDSTFKELTRVASEIESKKKTYFARARLAEDEEHKYQQDGESRSRPPALQPIQFGSRSVGPQEFHDIIIGMKRDMRTKSILTPLGLFEGCFIGEDAIAYLQLKFPKVPRADVRQLCQELLARRAVAPVVGGRDGKFSTALPYMFGRPVLKTGEPPHVKARKDAEVARLEYRAAVDSAEHVRGALEFHITDYLVAAQEAEIYRLSVAGEALLALESAQVFATNEVGFSWSTRRDGAGGLLSSDPSFAFPVINLLGCPSAAAGVDGIASRHRTGHLRVSPFVFESYEEGRTPHQVFGIGLEEMAKFTEVSVPALVLKCVASLADGLRSGKSSIDTWIMPNPDLPAVQFLRHEMNRVDGRGIKSASIRRYPPAVIAGVLRLFFVEAPVSLCSFEIYEPLKMLYANDHENFDIDVRLKSVESLLQTLSPPHFETLRLFTAYLHEMVKMIDPTDDRIPRLCWSLAPTILRPEVETPATLADEHPWRFTRDLIQHQPTLLGPLDLDAITTLPQSPEPEEEEDGEGVGEVLAARGKVGSRWKRRSRAATLTELRNEGRVEPPVNVSGAREVQEPAGSGLEEEDFVSTSSSITGGSTRPSSPMRAAAAGAVGGWGLFGWANGAKKGDAAAASAPIAEKAAALEAAAVADEKKAVEVAAPPAIEQPAAAAVVAPAVTKRLDDVMNRKHVPTPAATPEPPADPTPAPVAVPAEPVLEPVKPPVVDTSAPTGAPALVPETSTPTTPTTPTATAGSAAQARPPQVRPKRSQSAITSITSIASSVMFGLAAAAVTTVSGAPSASAEAEEQHDASMEAVQEERELEAEEAALWAQAAAGDEEVEFYDGNEVEEEEVEEEADGLRYPADGADLEEYMQFG
ncbi:hypothetical protein HK101_010412 [Irineochytrium annulatum]|nr:hypothetical protein HK101_010412 [Irineochytrium annulatum]